MNSEETRRYYQHSPSARWSVLIVVCLGSFLVTLSVSATLVALPAIGGALQAEAVYLGWIPAIYLLSCLVLLLPAGRLADIYGRKRIYFVGSSLFVLGALLAGLAPNIEMLLLCRIIQGASGAMLYTPGMAIISSVYQGEGCGGALGWNLSFAFLGFSCGPLLGGFITEFYGWDGVFFFQVPLGILILVLVSSKVKGEWLNENSQKLDWQGSIFLAIWVIALFVGISFLPSWIGFGSILFAGFFLFLFVHHTNRFPSPLVRLNIVWENRIYSRAALAILFMYGGRYGILFLLGLYLQYNVGMLPTEAGKIMMIEAIVLASLSPLVGKLSDRKRPWILAFVGCLTTGVAFGVLLLEHQTTSLTRVVISLVMLGIGLGLFSSPNSMIAMGAVSEKRLGMAAALLNFARVMGQMLGTVIVTLLISLYLGSVEISSNQYEHLSSILYWAVSIFLLFTMIAAYCSVEWKKL